MNQLKSGFEPQKELVAERALIVVAEATCTTKVEDAQKRCVAESAGDVVGAAAKDQKEFESKPVLKAPHILHVNYSSVFTQTRSTTLFA